MKSKIARNLVGIFAILFIQTSCWDFIWNLIAHPNTSMDFGPTDLPWQPYTMMPSSTVTKDAMEVKPEIASQPQHPTLTQTATATTTATATASMTTTLTQTVTATGTSVPPAPPCLVPLLPPEDNSFGSFGKISFSWESNIEAASYTVIVTAPNGTVMTFPVKTNEYSRWIESFSWGGEFTWQVAALDANGNTLCLSKPMRFTKMVTEASQTAVPQGSDPKPQGPHSTFP
jgi:hypothetical protein